MPKLISIPLANRFNIKLDKFYLNAYALKKYKTTYADSISKIIAWVEDMRKIDSEISKDFSYKTIEK